MTTEAQLRMAVFGGGWVLLWVGYWLWTRDTPQSEEVEP